MCIYRKGVYTVMTKEVIRLNISMPSVQYLCEKDKRLAKVITMVGEITYVPHKNHYARLVHSIIGQMLSNKVASVLSDRFIFLCEGEITPKHVHALSFDDIRNIGLSTSKAKYIKGLTDLVITKQLSFNDITSLSDEAIIKKLTSINGIGTWTAKMFLIFNLDRQDVLPFEDGAFLQSYRWMYKTDNCMPNDVIKKCAKWRPYSSIAARYLYRALDNGLTKNEFHLFK